MPQCVNGADDVLIIGCCKNTFNENWLSRFGFFSYDGYVAIVIYFDLLLALNVMVTLLLVLIGFIEGITSIF